MKYRSSFAVAYSWVFLLLVLGACLVMFGEKEERISESENRTLSGFPELTSETLFSGEFFTGIEDYLSDGMFGRDAVVGLSDGIMRLFSCTTQQDELILEEREIADDIKGDSAVILPEINPETYHAFVTEDNAKSPDAAFSLTDSMEGYGFWLEARNGQYVTLVTVKEDDIRIVADNLNSYRACLPEDGNVFYTNVPRSKTSQMLRNSPDYTGWRENTAEAMMQYLDEGVHYVNAPAMLEAGLLAGEELYFTSDHHWNPRGAMRVVNECIRLQGLPAVSYDEYEYRINYFVNEKEKTKDELALLYTLQDVRGYLMQGTRKADAVRLIYHGSSNYNAFLNGDTKGWNLYETGFSTGRNALVIGDSYSNCFLPYLMPYYDEVSKVDIRHFDPEKLELNLSDVIREAEIDDVYIVVTHLNGVSGDSSRIRLPYLLEG